MKKDVVIYFLGKIIPALVNLLIIILGVRFLGEEQYGRYSLIFYGTVLVSNICFTWIQQSMIRFLSFYKEKPSLVLSRFLLLTLFSVFTGAGLMFFVCLLYFKLSLHEILIVVFYTSMYIFFLFRLALYQAFMRPLKYASYEGAYNILLLLFLLGFIYLIALKSYLILFISMGSALFLTEVFHFLFLPDGKYKLDLLHLRWSKRFSKKIMDYGFTLTVWIAISTIMMMADRYIIKEFDNYSAVGIYSAMKDLITKISTFAILPIFLAYNAKINDAWNSGNKTKANTLIREALKIEFLVFLMVSLIFFLFRDFLFTHILHLRSDGLFFSSVFLILSSFLWQAAMIIHKPFELLLKQKTMVILILISLFANISLNLIFVPRYGFQAAAVSSLVSVCLYIMLNLFLSKLYRQKQQENNSG